MLEDRLDHSRSTVRGQAGMLMELHVWVGFEGLNVCTPISLSNPSPHEQPIETSHLVQCIGQTETVAIGRELDARKRVPPEGHASACPDFAAALSFLLINYTSGLYRMFRE